MLCIKIEPDFSMLAESDWRADEQGQIDCRYARRQLNGFDQSAAELALRLGESHAANRLTAVTVGHQDVEPVLKVLLALEFDNIVRIAPPGQSDLRFNPTAVAQLLGAYERLESRSSVVIFGSQSGEGQNGQTGPILAEILGWPCVTQVTEVSMVGENRLHVTRQTASDKQTLTLNPPVVLVTGQGEQVRQLRIPTLKQKLAATRKTCDVLVAEALMADITTLHSSPRLLALERLELRRAGVIIAGQNPQEKARILYQQFLRHRLLP